MDEILSMANKLGGAGFATLLLIILYGNWKGIWMWSRDAEKMTAQYEKMLAASEQETEWWRSVAIKATGIAELQGTVARELAKKTESKP